MDIKRFEGKYARASNGDVFKLGRVEHSEETASVYVKGLDFVLTGDPHDSVRVRPRPRKIAFGVYELGYSMAAHLEEISHEEFEAALAKAIRRQAHYAVKNDGSAFWLQFKGTRLRRAILAEMIREVKGDL